MKYCHKCQKDFSQSDNFCDECGVKLEKKARKERKQEEKESKHKKIKVNLPKWIIISVIILLLGSVFFVFVVPLPYQAQESYREQEPYSYESCDSVPFSYQVTKVENRNFGGPGLCVDDGSWGSTDGKCSTYTHVYIRNLDSKAGEFNLECTNSKGDKYITSKGYIIGTGYISFGASIEPNGQKEVDCFFSYSIDDTLYISY